MILETLVVILGATYYFFGCIFIDRLQSDIVLLKRDVVILNDLEPILDRESKFMAFQTEKKCLSYMSLV